MPREPMARQAANILTRRAFIDYGEIGKRRERKRRMRGMLHRIERAALDECALADCVHGKEKIPETKCLRKYSF